MLEKWPFLDQNCGLSPLEKCTVARKGHYNFFFLPKLSRDKMKSYRAIISQFIARSRSSV